MLNRRILRIKAMQALYGFFTSRDSLSKVVRRELESVFTPDPLTHDLSDTEEIDAHRHLALRLYDEYLPKKRLDADEEIPEVVFKEVSQSIKTYYDRVKTEIAKTKQSMLSSARNLQVDYYKFLLLPGEFQFVEKQQKEKKEQAFIPKNDVWHFNLLNNPIIEALDTCQALQKQVTKHKLSWQSDAGLLKGWYRDILRKNEQFEAYQKNEHPSLDEHRTALTHLFKKILLKNETMMAEWEERDIRWSEDSAILKSMLSKTIQEYDPDREEPIELKTISVNEEDDFEFFETIYNATIQEEESLEQLINERTKNWDISRLAMTDRIILKMALAEMMHCRSIPVKVSINEYIEICKQYSTPKSKQFVNGILDVLANQLTSEGVIKKTGRGLIDNK